MAKIAPATTRLWFHINSTNLVNFIDLSLAASAANRRFYRQGTSWAVAGMTLHTDSGIAGSFDTSKVPDTWMAHNAHTKSKELWFESQDQVLDVQPTVAARYRDFKVHLDTDMVGAAIQDVSNLPANNGEILLPIDRLNSTAKIGEWTYSTYQLPRDGGSLAPFEKLLHFVGPDKVTAPASLGMISGYGLSRSRPSSIEPNTPRDGGWMLEVMDVADNLDEIRDDLSENNDVPPYRVGNELDVLEYYPGGVQNQPNAALHAVNFISGSTVGGKTAVHGGMFHCGLIRFDWELTGLESSMFLAIDLVPGTQKGYLTEAY
jgi:hypothetical protein